MFHGYRIDDFAFFSYPCTIDTMSDGASWTLHETQFIPSEVPKYETLFSLGNGFLGIRGSFDEHSNSYKPGTFINGFHETEPIVYGEHAYGYAEDRQRMLEVPDGTYVKILVDNEEFDMTGGELLAYERYLDMREGTLERRVRWRSPAGREVELSFSRLVSFSRSHTAALRISCRAINAHVHISLISALSVPLIGKEDHTDPRLGLQFRRKPIVLQGREHTERGAVFRHTTQNSKLRLVSAMENAVVSGHRHWSDTETQLYRTRHTFEIPLETDDEVVFEKYIAYSTSLDAETESPAASARKAIEKASRLGFQGLREEQQSYLDRFWDAADFEIEAEKDIHSAVRFSQFHLLQAAGRDGRRNIPAKGMTGSGYEGHYFWDTEIYMLPFFTYACPEIAEALIRYRNTTLPAARARAAELHHRGCLYPWRTIDGREASAYFPAGTAQYHINADIAYAIKRHARARNAEGLPADFAAEILFESARFWADFGDYIEGKGFCINMVTGPDEYTAMVDNNCFTNLMVRDSLKYAARTARKMRAEAPEEFRKTAGKIRLAEEEITDWERAAVTMYIPYDEELGIYPQDDGFLRKAEWDFENTPRENYPLLLHYHPLTIYRHQVLKQPDLVLALFLQSRLFSDEEKRRNYAYYDRLTTGDSSLSACVQGILATETGDPERGYEYFLDTLYMDLDDINRNTRDGIHAAAMGGVWLGLVYGFAGMRDDGEILRFSPCLPGKMTRLAFSLAYRGGTLRLDITGERTLYSRKGPAVEIDHRDERIRLGDGNSETRKNPPLFDTPSTFFS